MIKLLEIDENSTKTLASLASEIWHEYWVDLLSQSQIDYMVNLFQSENAIKNQIKNDNYTYFLIFKDEKIAGYCGVSQKENYLFLSKLYVKKDFRHQKIGTQTFELLKGYAKETSNTVIKLTVNKHNENTIAAYKKWGFQIIDAVVTDIGSGYVMDDYIMEYQLS